VRGIGERRYPDACSAGPKKRDPLEEVEGRDEVDRALATLTVRQGAAVVLTELLDCTSEEAGRLLGVRPGTVRVLAQHGRDTLRKTMEKPVMSEIRTLLERQAAVR
jgi:DNA-directed RNA polymerase specialized sigma24 family protein